MTRKKTDSNIRAISQDEKALQREIRANRKHQRDILKSQGKSLKEFRHEVASLKKLGIVSKKTDARSVEPTRHFRAKVRKLKDVLLGRAIAVKAPKQVRDSYYEKGIYKKSGAFLIVEKEHPTSTAKVVDGHIEVTRPVGRTKNMTEIVLPYDPADMLELANMIAADPNIPSELDGAASYVFSMFGHTSSSFNQRVGFPNKEELVEHITKHYKHLFQGENGKQGVRHFALVKYTGASHPPPEIPEGIAGEKFYSPRSGGRKSFAKRGEDYWMDERKRRNRAYKDKQKRDAMTPEQREEYLRKGRERAANSLKKKRAERDDYGF